jgi:hypothetical protein
MVAGTVRGKLTPSNRSGSARLWQTSFRERGRRTFASIVSVRARHSRRRAGRVPWHGSRSRPRPLRLSSQPGSCYLRQHVMMMAWATAVPGGGGLPPRADTPLDALLIRPRARARSGQFSLPPSWDCAAHSLLTHGAHTPGRPSTRTWQACRSGAQGWMRLYVVGWAGRVQIPASRPSRRPCGGSVDLAPHQGGGSRPGGAGMPDCQPQATHQPSRLWPSPRMASPRPPRPTSRVARGRDRRCGRARRRRPRGWRRG